MNNFIPFDSRQEFFKTPFGSVPTGTPVRFTVCLPRGMGCTGVTLVLREDGAAHASRFAFSWRSTDGETELWDCVSAVENAGLYWYHFDYSVPWGTGHIFLAERGVGCLSGSDRDWQLTVYDRSFQTPGWLRGGLIYQIFPDRFYCSGEKKKNVPADRILRDDRENLPYWRPDENGRIRNNDFFGGDLKGIEEKLPYLASLGVTCLYLNPIFEAQSNHRYDTSDYLSIDPLLGDAEDFRSLCRAAARYGISVIFDGVYSHTGDDSIYFNKYGRYGSGGAYNDPASPYARWYNFGANRDDYRGWWGIDILPEVNENEPSFTSFITGEGGVLDVWLGAGARGVRLDVADELPDAFIDNVRAAVKRNGADNFVLGEVWEDATDKFSYGHRRRYLLGGQLDSVMNYPFRDAIIAFLRTRRAEDFMEQIMRIAENYPPPALHTAMNHLGTHDTERILTALSDVRLPDDRESQSRIRLTDRQIEDAKNRLRAAAVLQYTLPGVPSLYYGDEAGAQGGRDPFNRAFYPWGREDAELIEFFRTLGRLRRDLPMLKEGRFRPLSAALQCAAYLREDDTGRIAVIANRNDHGIDYFINCPHRSLSPLLNATLSATGVYVPAESTAIVRLD